MDDLPTKSQNPAQQTLEFVGGAKKRKRSASSYDEIEQPAEKYLEIADVFTLDRFSDEVLFEIFKNLDTFSLLALEKTCLRFYGLVQDYRLWNDINVLAKEKSVTELKHVLKRANKNTKKIKINGIFEETNSEYKEQRECLLKYVVPKCENLIDLELQNVFIDFLTIKIQDFPKNLKRLVFREVSVRWPDNVLTVFKKMDRSLLWLEDLGVESCTWFHPYDIMLFSKCPSLKKLSLRGCQNLSDFVPYGSMASRFGFKSLEYLDVRDTPITDSDLQCFNAILTLKILLLQCPAHLRVRSPDDKSSATQVLSPSGSSSSGISTSDSSSDSLESLNEDANDGEPSTSRRRPHEAANVLMTIDLLNTRTVLLHGRVCRTPIRRFRTHPDAAQGNYHSCWDMIYRQTSPDCGPCSSAKAQICPITNRGISCFGRPENPIDRNVIWIRIGNRPSDNTFEKLYIRHYKRVTDDSLKHLVQCSPNLTYLDVSGCGVTQEGIDEFKIKKPECVVLCEHLNT